MLVQPAHAGLHARVSASSLSATLPGGVVYVRGLLFTTHATSGNPMTEARASSFMPSREDFTASARTVGGAPGFSVPDRSSLNSTSWGTAGSTGGPAPARRTGEVVSS